VKGRSGLSNASSPGANRTGNSARTQSRSNEPDAEIKALKAEEQRLRATSAPISGESRTPLSASRVPGAGAGLRDGERDLRLAVEAVRGRQLAESMEQSRQGEQFRILDSAIPAKQPLAPNRIGSSSSACCSPSGRRRGGGAGRAARHLFPHVRRPPVVRQGAGAGEHPTRSERRGDGRLPVGAGWRRLGHARAGSRRAGGLSRAHGKRAVVRMLSGAWLDQRARVWARPAAAEEV